MPVPTTAYDDLLIHPRDNDLVIGTHGRGIWILDDLGPLAAWDARVASAPAHIFPIRSAAIFQYWKDTSYRAQEAYAGDNPADGAIITYSLGDGSGPARIVIEDERGDFVREMIVPNSPGVHRINWDLRHPLPGSSTEWRPHDEEGLARTIENRGHFVSPGTFRVVLDARGVTWEQSLVVTGDPELPVTLAQYREREEFLSEVLALGQEVERVRDELSALSRGDAGRAGRIEELDRALNQGRAALAGIYQSMNGGGVRQGSLYPPTATHRERKERVAALLASAREEFESLSGMR
jgi:hypothetical protein